MKEARLHDVVSLGEVMLRLAPPRYLRLRQARRFDVEVAGSQFNVTANLARFGKRTAFVTRLPESELGTLVLDACASHGVDTRYVASAPDERLGLNFLEFTATPRTPRVIYDRANSAASRIRAQDFDWLAILQNASVAHTDGIMPGLSADCAAATQLFLETARAAGCTTSFDLNYREHLWNHASARSCWSELLPYVDVLVSNRDVSEQVFGYSGTDQEIADRYVAEFGCSTVVLTHREMEGVSRGAWSSTGWQNGDQASGRRFGYESVDRYGTGDVFMAGLLYGLLEADLAFGLDFGNAACALAHTIEGDIAQFSSAEVRHIMGDVVDLRVRR